MDENERENELGDTLELCRAALAASGTQLVDVATLDVDRIGLERNGIRYTLELSPA